MMYDHRELFPDDLLDPSWFFKYRNYDSEGAIAKQGFVRYRMRPIDLYWYKLKSQENYIRLQAYRLRV